MQPFILNGIKFNHVECLEDFCGNWKSPGFWADLWRAESGAEVVTLGGCWPYYAAPGDVEQIEKILTESHYFQAAEILPVFRANEDALHHVLEKIKAGLKPIQKTL